MQKILLVTKRRFMGDTIAATPAIRALRKAHPEARLTLMAGRAAIEAMQGCPWIADFIERHRGFDPKILRDKAFDAAVVFDRSVNSAWTVWRARIPIRIGHRAESRSLLLTHPVSQDPSLTEIESLCKLTEVLDAKPKNLLPELWLSHKEREANRLPSGRWVGIQPGANDPDRRLWPPERWAPIARFLSKAGWQIAIFGVQNEAEYAEKFLSEYKGEVLNLIGKTTLREAMAKIAQCGLWLSGDTGLRHVAVSLGVPSVSAHNPNTGHRWGYRTEIHRTIYRPSDRKLTHSDAGKALREIQSDEIIETLQDLLPQIAVSSAPSQ